MARKTLHERVIIKANELRVEEVAQAEAATSFIAAAERASTASRVANTQAEAVEHALTILEEAGVRL